MTPIHMEVQTENPTGGDETQKGFLKTFWQLSEGGDDTRIDAAASLLRLLADKQGKKKVACQDLNYALKRLVRGLSSSRKCARLGFAMALSQALKTFPVVTVADLIETVYAELKLEHNDTRGEQREIIFGRALAYMSVIQSGRLPELSGDELSKIVKGLLKVQEMRSPLHLLCCEGLIHIIRSVDKSEFQELVWPNIREMLSTGWNEATPDMLWLLMIVREHQKSVVDKTFMSQYWGCKDIYQEKNLQKIAGVVMFCSSDHPVIHPLCPKLIEAAARDQNLASFWNVTVNEKLLHAEKVNRKYLALQLVPVALSVAQTVEEVEAIISSDLIRELLRNLAHKGNILCQASKQLVAQITEFVRTCKNSEIQLAVLTTLIKSPGSVLFDSITRTKTIATIINSLNIEAARSLLLILEALIRGEDPLEVTPVEPNSHEFETKRKWAVTTLSKMVVLPAALNDAALQSNILQFLLLSAFFNVDDVDREGRIPHCNKKFPVPLSMSLRHILQETFFGTLNRLSTYRTSTMVNAKDRRPFINTVNNLIIYAKLLISEEDLVTLTKSWEPEVANAWNKSTQILEKIHAKHEDDEKMNEGHAFQLLFMHCSLQLLKSPESAMEALAELHACYGKASAKKKRRSVAPKAETEPEWVDVITDLLLSLLSQNSRLVRVVVNDVFTILSPYATNNTVGQILDVLSPGDEDDEAALGFEDVEEEDEDEEEDKEEDEGNKSDSSEKSATENESSDSESEEDEKEEEEAEQVDDKYRASVKAALGNAAVDSESEGELSDLDDDAMFKLDGALAAVMKNRIGAKQSEIEKERQLQIYKNKCLDLLETLVKGNRSPSILLELIIPLLELIEMGYKETAMKELGEKAKKLLHLVTRPGKLPPDPAVDRDELTASVETLIEFSKKVSRIPMMAKDVADAVMLVVRITMERDSDTGPSPVRTRSMRVVSDTKKTKSSPAEGNLSKIQTIVSSAVTDFCTKRDSNINHVFLQNILQKQTTLMWPVADILVKCSVDSDVRIYSRSQACQILVGMITNQTVANLDPEEWKTVAVDCMNKMIKTVETLATDEQSKPKYTTSVLQVILQLLKVGKPDLFEGADFGGLRENVSSMKSGTTHKNKDMKQMFNKILGSLSGFLDPLELIEKSKKKKKRKADKDESEQAEAKQAKTETEKTEKSSPISDEMLNNKTPSSKSKKKKKRKSEVLETSVRAQDLSDSVKHEGMNGTSVNGVMSSDSEQAASSELKTPVKNLLEDIDGAGAPSSVNKSKKKHKSPAANVLPSSPLGSPSPATKSKLRRKSLRSAIKPSD